MKIEAKLWPLEGEQDFKEIWPSDLGFDQTWPIFKDDWDIIQTNILIKFNEDWSKTVPLEGEQGFNEIWPTDLVFDLTWPIFKSDRDIIMSNILVKFHKDWSNTLVFRGWTTQMLTTHNTLCKTVQKRTTDTG